MNAHQHSAGWSVPGGPAETVRDRFGNSHQRPATTMRSPWGYLAFLLRHLDPSDLAAEQQLASASSNCLTGTATKTPLPRNWTPLTRVYADPMVQHVTNRGERIPPAQLDWTSEREVPPVCAHGARMKEPR